jgi:hypothetical protein
VPSGYSSVETSGSLTRRWVVSAGKHRSAKHGPLFTPIGPPASSGNFIVFRSDGIATRLCAVDSSSMSTVWWGIPRNVVTVTDCFILRDPRDRRCIQFRLEIAACSLLCARRHLSASGIIIQHKENRTEQNGAAIYRGRASRLHSGPISSHRISKLKRQLSTHSRHSRPA